MKSIRNKIKKNIQRGGRIVETCSLILQKVENKIRHFSLSQAFKYRPGHFS